MALDGFLIRGLQYELDEKLSLGRVDKIYQPEKDGLLFTVRSKGKTFKLLISCNSDHPGIYITEGAFENPPNPSSLCMFFRKHLQGSKITNICQYETERVLEIHFEASDELGFKVKRILVVELLGRYSNIILLDDNMKILDSIKRGSLDSNSDRLILPGQKYSYPPQRGKVPFTNVLTKNYSFNTEEEVCNTFQGISIPLAHELLREGDFSSKLKQLIEDIKSLRPTVYIKEKNNNKSPKDIHIVPMSYDNEYVAFDTISEALDYYYSKRSTSNRLEQKKSSLKKSLNNQIKKSKLKKQRLLEDIHEAKNSGHYQLYGELLMANLYRAKTGDPSVVLNNYYTNEDIKVPLDKKISPSKNAQNYFKKFSKSKRAVIEKTKQMERVDLDISYLESSLTFLENAKNYQEVDAIGDELSETGFLQKKVVNNQRKKKKKITLKEYTSSNGNRILVGRNNKENDFLTFSLASRGDLWFHTKDIPGSHVVLILDGKEATKEEIIQASEIAALYSKANSSENIPVDYVKIKYVKKIPGAKPGMVTFTNNRTVYSTPTEIKD